jgi:integrase/recombinase XerC
MNQLAPVIASQTPARRGRARLPTLSRILRRQHPQQEHAPRVRAGDTEFLAWCERAGVASIADVKPLHVAAYIEQLGRKRSAPTVKQRLAAIRHLFDWLVTGQVMPVNPASSVRGPSHSVKRGKTLVRDPSEARALLDSIDVTTPVALRDRALIGLMVY